MEWSRKRIERAGGVVGGALLLACTACCVPLFASLLAWVGVAGLALMGPIGMLAGVSAAAAILWVALARRRRRLQCRFKNIVNSTCQAACCPE